MPPPSPPKMMYQYLTTTAEPPSVPQSELFLSNGDPTLPQPEFLGFKITSDNGYVVTDEHMSFETWQRGLKALQMLGDQVGLAKAKHINFGIATFGRDKVDMCCGQLELPLQDVKRAIDIGTIPPGITYRNLSDDHYVILARGGLTPKKLAHWAKIASIQNLSPGQLKASINAGEVVDPKTADSVNHGLASVHGVNHEFSVWLRRVNGAHGILRMEAAAVKEIMGELEPIAKLYHQLLEGVAKLNNKPQKRTAQKAVKGKKPAKK